MTLGRRALLLIFPVVLASYAVAALTVYFVERDTLLRLEQTRLEQQFGQLEILYRNDETIARGLLTSLVGMNQFHSFLQATDDGLRTNALASRVERILRSLTGDPGAFVSLAVVRRDLDVAYYGENSDDPFAEIDVVQRVQASDVFDGRVRSGQAMYLSGSPHPLVVISELIDPQTMNAPIGDRHASALVVQVAIRPARFARAWQDMEAAYGAPLETSTVTLTPNADLSAVGALGRDLHLRLTPSRDYFTGRSRALLILLGSGALVMSLLSIGLLMALVRRFITRPVAELDHQVTQVMSGARTTILAARTSSEVGRLTDNVKRLHETVADSLTGIRRASYTDTLTGISNRAHFQILAAESLHRAALGETERTLLFMDVDHFKFVNDRYGHETGDTLLKDLAGAIDAAVRAHASAGEVIVARLSGDEFAALVPGDGLAASAAAGAILRLFENGYALGGERYPIGLSIGLATYPAQAANLEELVVNADAAMYDAKSHGRNRFALFTPEIRALRLRCGRIQEALRGLDPNEEFHLVYMPIVDGTERVVSCEALLRWTSPTLGVVRPDEFVPIAERNGLFSKIDRWVIDRALADHAQLRAWFGESFVLSVNVSSAELHATTLLPYVVEQTRAHGVNPRGVEIELTETFAVEDGQDVARALAALQDAGFRIAIDDFGAGFTCIRQITEYRADTIKLDRLFLDRLVEDASQTTLDALVALCHAQGMTVVAEGIDTHAKHAMMTAAGCDLFQGFGISPPLPLAELGAWARRNVTSPPEAPETPLRRRAL